MTKQYTYMYNIENGVGKIQGRKQFERDIQQIGDGRMIMTLKRYKAKRSLGQNNLIHMYFDIIAKETGNSLERVKNILKSHFLTTSLLDEYGELVVNPKTGETITYVRDTHELNKEEMYTFTENVRVFAMDFNIYLPLPEEQVKINY